MDDEENGTPPLLFCETCVYENGRIGTLYRWETLIAHVRKNHWTKAGHAANGQPIFLCQGCGEKVQLSYFPHVDFAGNLFCSVICLKTSYEDRLTSHQVVHIIKQEMNDEAYIRKSLGMQ